MKASQQRQLIRAQEFLIRMAAPSLKEEPKPAVVGRFRAPLKPATATIGEMLLAKGQYA
jgi:hypothetical protein